ncbi:MAG TPA: alpha/beta hydrolase [Acidimicrobiales bacterium]|nr:alpha/beta hydrolase [Acidimicrobiales bacterium]
MARATLQSLGVLADRIAVDAQWLALALQPRGLPDAPGDFSASGWVEDIAAAVTSLRTEEGAPQVFLAGLGLGGALCVAAAAADPAIGGVATLGAPADLMAWAGDVRSLLAHARSVGLIRSPNFPPDVDQWNREWRDLRPLDLARQLDPRPVMVIHGNDDDVVPDLDARALADSSGDGADLRLIAGAGHHLRNDPRAVAILLGWLSRQ